MTNIPPPPPPPLNRLIKEGVPSTCPICRSSAIRRPMIIGNKYCVNPQCENYTKPIFKK